MGTGQIHRDSFEELTEKYFEDINDCYSKKCLQEIVVHYTELIYEKPVKPSLEKNRIDLLNWVKSELKQELNPKITKTITPYSEEKVKFLSRALKKLDV